MVNKKEFTIEELKKMYEDSLKESNTLGEMLKQKEQEEEDRRKAQLALEKENRKKELDDAVERVDDLLQAYIKDYGSYSAKYNGNEYIPIKRLFPWWF